MAERLGFSAEGVLHKHMVWREANRDSALYAMTNSDWRQGAQDHIHALLKRRFEGAVGLAPLDDNADDTSNSSNGREEMKEEPGAVTIKGTVAKKKE